MPTRTIRRTTALILCLLVAGLALAAPSYGARPLTTGLEDGDVFQSLDQPTRNLWLNRAVDANAGIVRLAVIWPAIVPGQTAPKPADPTNPGSASYNFASVDGSIRDASAKGLKVLLAVNGAPDYAEQPGRPADLANKFAWRPNPPDVAAFMQAVAARYNGTFDPDGAGPQGTLPSADAIEVWNEPNSSDWINPQFDGKTPVGADIYRNMLNASYPAIKSVNPRINVVAAGTEPYGDTPGGPYPPGSQRTAPVLFWQRVLCVTPTKTKKSKKKAAVGAGVIPKQNYTRTPGCDAPVRFDILAHHPIDNTGSGPLKTGPRKDDASTPDLGRITAVLRGAEKAGTTLGGNHPLWATEFWWDSKPPNAVGAPLMTQARWIEQSLYLFWKAGAAAAINFQIADSAMRNDAHAGFQAGLYFEDGRPKPALTAFKFPFVTDRTSTTNLIAWGKAPESGQLKIQRKAGGWKTVRKLQVAKGSTFATKLKLRGKQQLRAKVGSSTSIIWQQPASITKPKGAAAAAAGGKGGGPPGPIVGLLVVGGLGLLCYAGAWLRRRQRGQRPGQSRLHPLVG